MIGYCRFCGQSRLIEAEDGMTEEDANKRATELCECVDATHEAWKNSTLEVFGQDLEVMFGKRPEIKRLLRYAGEQILDNKMIALTVRRSTEQTISLKLKDHGLCITRTDRTKEESISYG